MWGGGDTRRDNGSDRHAGTTVEPCANALQPPSHGAWAAILFDSISRRGRHSLTHPPWAAEQIFKREKLHGEKITASTIASRGEPAQVLGRRDGGRRRDRGDTSGCERRNAGDFARSGACAAAAVRAASEHACGGGRDPDAQGVGGV